jgi:ATP-dependent DNA helicase RecG
MRESRSTAPSSEVLVERFRKILELERKKEFQDTAVAGGLDRFLSNFASDLLDAGVLAVRRIQQRSYRAMTQEERRAWVDEVLAGAPSVPSQSSPGGQPSAASPASTQRASISSELERPITVLSGMGSQLAAKFHNMGLSTIRDLLYFFPRRHNDFSRKVAIAELQPGEEQSVMATVWEAHERRLPTGRRAVEVVLGDESGNVRAIWFGNRSYLLKQLEQDTHVVVSGKMTVFRGQPQFEDPEYEIVDKDYLELVHTGRIVPVYPATEGLAPRTIRRLVKSAVDQWGPALKDFLPEPVRAEAGFLSLSRAIQQAHFPDSLEMKDEARRRLAFDELFLMQVSILQSRLKSGQLSQSASEGQGGHPPMKVDRHLLDTFLAALPFQLTQAQQRALEEVLQDLQSASGGPMSRLVQGEVGSGKTVLALASIIVAVANNYQAALMAPTEILAEQHFQTVARLTQGLPRPVQETSYFSFYLSPFPRPIGVGLLTGSQRPKEKERLQGLLQEGDMDIAIGTHALIQGDVAFQRLGLAVVDEQHRFGVGQRQALRQKGYHPHLLVMTATPIPRTLALTLYGDLDISVLNELPQGQRKVKTLRLRPSQRERAYQFLEQQVAQGRQAFIICPLIEESDAPSASSGQALEVKAATAEFERLRTEVYPHLAGRIGLLHGRQSADEKDQVMGQFRSGVLAMLVATPVVEVGIDVPNANVMLVEGADRFGLAQLHQLRGRIGRGGQESWFLLLSESSSKEAMERLAILERTDDGFLLAERDLELRGPGEVFGTRQSGWPDLKMARLSDLPLLELAREQARKLLGNDPRLSRPEHRLLKQEVERLTPRKATEIS